MSGDNGLGNSAALRFFAFYGMGFLALAMARPERPVAPAWLIGLHGWGIDILLVARGGFGLVASTLVLTGARDGPFDGCDQSEPGRDSIGMTGMVREPLFVICGALLIAVVHWARARRRT